MSDSTTTIVLQTLLTRFTAGDDSAKRELINRAHARLILVTRKLLGSFVPVRAEEETAGVLNDAYLRLHTSMDEVKPPTVRQFMGLAALEIRRTLLDRIRKMRGRGEQARPNQVSLDSNEHDVADPDIDEGRRILALDLLEALETLPEEEREAVELLFFHGCTQPEAAAIVGVHEDTIKRRWSKARIKLAGMLTVFGPSA